MSVRQHDLQHPIYVQKLTTRLRFTQIPLLGQLNFSLYTKTMSADFAAINGKDKNQASEDLRRISTAHPEVQAICLDFKFPRRGQRDTPAGLRAYFMHHRCQWPPRPRSRPPAAFAVKAAPGCPNTPHTLEREPPQAATQAHSQGQ